MSMLNKNTKIAILGLGVLGGGYAEGLSKAGYSIIGIDINPETVDYAKKEGWIQEGGTNADLVQAADLVISCLYPHTFLKWIEDNKDLLKEGALLTDVTGVKRAVIERVNEQLDGRVEYIACHPMAGKESKGILYADASRFQNANFLIVPTKENTKKAIETAYDIAKILGFGNIKEVTPEEHDRMIGFLSQLTHVIAVSLMNTNDNTDLAEFTGDSFRDLTRIANINEELWPELFILNKDYLLREIDDFIKEMNNFRNLLETEDFDGMKEKMIQSTERRKVFEKK